MTFLFFHEILCDTSENQGEKFDHSTTRLFAYYLQLPTGLLLHCQDLHTLSFSACYLDKEWHYKTALFGIEGIATRF